MTNIQVTYAAQDNKGITLTEKNNKPVTNSREVAENFGKNHQHVMESIRNLTGKNTATKNYFYKTTYTNDRGREYPIYYMTKEGFLLLTSSFRGAKAQEVKAKILAETDMIPPALPERKELVFVDVLKETMKPLGLTIETQKVFPKLDFRVDVFIPELNLAIEYDEKEHIYKIENDEQRQMIIQARTGIEFLRVSEEVSHLENVGIVFAEILKLKGDK